MAAALAFLFEHLDVVEALYEVITGGAKKTDVLKAIRATAVAASDAEMHKELDP